MQNAPVIIEKQLHASPETVWQALTDKDRMKQWYFTLDDFKPEIGVEFRFPGQGQKGEHYLHICNITEVIPLRKLQYSWRYENLQGNSLVTFELFEEGNGTRIRVTHEGLETFPPDNPDFDRASFTEGWTQLITVLLPKFLGE